MSHKLCEVREHQGMTVAELAILTGLSKSVIYRIENDNSGFKINDSTALALATAVGMTVESLFQPQELSDQGRPPFTGRPIQASGYDSLLGQADICPGGCNLVLPRSRVCDVHGNMSHHYLATAE
jgi:DNA-binding XRE family transcriptional regulator